MRDLAVPGALAQRGIDGIVACSLPLRTRFRRTQRRDVLLLHGPAGWGEFGPFPEYGPEHTRWWLAAAIDAATAVPPPPRRAHVPVNVTVPPVGPDEAIALVAASGASTAKVKVAEPGGTLDEDVDRVAAVRSALGPTGRIRLDANGGWDAATATRAIARLLRSAGSLEYVEQPCASLEGLREVRRATGVAVAVDESLRLAPDPFLIDLADAADVLVLKVPPLGGVGRALAIAEAHGLPTVVSSALDTSVGLAAGVALAASLPEAPLACGLGTATLLASDVVGEPLAPHHGVLAVADADRARRGESPSDAAARTAARAEDAVTAALVDRLVAALAAMDGAGEARPSHPGPAASAGRGATG